MSGVMSTQARVWLTRRAPFVISEAQCHAHVLSLAARHCA